MILGAHESVAGGLHLAPERGRAHGAEALQIFTKNASQWRSRPFGVDEPATFAAACRRHGIRAVMAHDSYLINLASPDPVLWRRSILAFADELERCAQLGVPFLVTHPGSPGERGERWGLDRVAAGLDAALARARAAGVTVLLENTAGQGHQLGDRFEHLGAIRRASDHPGRIAACFDTQHAFAAGYDLVTPDGYAATFAAFDSDVGLDRLWAFHLNDSKRPCGSRVDRHERIGCGLLGDVVFRRLVNDPVFAETRAVLETPPLPSGRPSFASGLRRLRSLVGAAGGRSPRSPRCGRSPRSPRCARSPRSPR
jgi:deoxyribonuclease IV